MSGLSKTINCWLLLVAGLLFSGCAEKSKLSDSRDITGLYTLVTVDGKQLPATVSHDRAKLEIRSGAFTINADGTCSSKMIFVPPSGKERTHEVNATYTRNGSRLKMQWERAGQTVGTVEGDTFTMTNEGMVLAYRK